MNCYDNIVDDEVIPMCCDNQKIELVLVREEYMHMYISCGSMRPELD